MNYSKALERIQKSGMLSNWTWTQEKWDEIAKVYADKNFSWGKSLAQLFGFAILIILLNIGNTLFVGGGRLNTVQITSSLTAIQIISLLVVVIFLLFLFYKWFHKSFFPTPKIGDKPQVVLGKEGVIIGSKIFLWEPPAMKINKIELVNQEVLNYSMIQLEIIWGLGVGKIIIPVPKDKGVEAQQAISSIDEWSKVQKYGNRL